jgi:cell fate regulator YaaT (PSP1 superfamily)
MDDILYDNFAFLSLCKVPAKLPPANITQGTAFLLSSRKFPLLIEHINPVTNENFKMGFRVASLKYCNRPKQDYSNFCEVVFNSQRKQLFRNDMMVNASTGTYVIVEVENGIDIGTVYSCGNYAADKLKSQYRGAVPKFSILRLPTLQDLETFVQNSEDEENVIIKTKSLVQKHNLDMKVTKAEWQFDRQRLTIYFTAPQRIDFRELVRDLARNFRTRIELRQISTREEAKRLGGVGSCGRDVCCNSLECEFCHVTLDHARTQQLSNNVAKLSGYCGRLKCCLLYEFDNYQDAMKKYPPLNSTVELDDGKGRIVKADVFRDLVYVQLESSPTYRIVSLIELNELFKLGRVKCQCHEEGKSMFRAESDAELEELKALED